MSEEGREIPTFSDGVMDCAVARSDGSLTSHRLDLLCVKLACEETERKHKLATDVAGNQVPTIEFLRDLSDRLIVAGIDDCTPTIAWQVWCAVANEMARLKKNTN
jgi:hypothetical protein